MYWFRRLLLLLPGRRRARAEELEAEMRANLSLAIQDAAESGLSPDEAARTARRDFGSLTRAHEEARAVWFPGWDTLLQDLRLSRRALTRTPAFTAVAVLSLALGTGAATALFSLVDTVVIRPLAYREPGRLVFIREVVPPLAHIYPTLPANAQHFFFWREHAQAFESLAAVNSQSMTLQPGGDPEVVGGAVATASLFDVLGVQPQLGRTFRKDEEQPKANRVAVISDGLWRRRFGASPSIIGQNVRMDDATWQVIGVLPPTFHFPKKDDLGALARMPERAEIFVPLREYLTGWGGDYDYSVFGRLRQGIAPAQGAADLNLLEQRIASENQLNSGLHVQLRPLQEVMSSPVRTSLAVLLSAVLLLVLIVCVNLANLLLARGNARAREFSLRIALGASRGRLLLSALMETLLLAIAGGALGLLAAQLALQEFVRRAPVDLPRLDEVQIDGRVMAFAFSLSLLCGLLFGLLPALRLSKADPQGALRGSGPTVTAGARGLRLREFLVGAEVSLSTLLLVLAGLLVSSLYHVLRVDRGFVDDHALEVRVSLPPHYRTTEEQAAFFDRAVERLRSLPGVRAVSAASRVPLTGESNVNSIATEGAKDDALDPVTRKLVMVNVRFVGPEYFNALGIPLRRGRMLEDADRERNVAVVSERLAAKLWPGENPLDRVLSSGSGVSKARVVGVVADVHSTQLERDPTLMVYVPYWKRAFQVGTLVVRSAADSHSLPEEIRRSLLSIDSGLPPPRMRTMGEIVAQSVVRRRFQMDVAVSFAVSALLLAMLGIYGVVAYSISLRRRELGIRMALGARGGQVRRMVLWQGLRPVFLGLGSGVLVAVAAGQLIQSLLFGVQATDAVTLGAIAAGLAAVSMIACLVPAQSVSGIDPSRVLRDE